MANHHHWCIIQPRNATYQRGIIGEVAITVQLVKVGEDVFEVVQRVGTLRVP